MKFDLYNTKHKRNIFFLVVLAFFAIICVFEFFEHGLIPQSTTVFAFSYKYGFISRGLMGTIWLVLDKIIPVNLMSFKAIYLFTKIMTVVWYAVLFCFYYVCLKFCNIKDERNTRYLICLLSVFSFPMFVTEENFGRLDLYLMILTVFACILIIKEQFEWLIVPIVAICMIMHHGYVFMYLNIILVLFFYKILMREQKRKKYIVLFTSTFLIASALFLYFEFFSHPEGNNIADEIIALAKALSQDGKSYSTSMVDHEILGLDVYDDEWYCHMVNRYEIPLALFFYSPYLVIGLHFFRGLFRKKNAKEIWAYLGVALGVLTLLPQMILKVDYGRYLFAAFFYYIAMILCLIAMKDEHIINQLEKTKAAIKRVIPCAQLLIAYPMLFQPFLDVSMSYDFWQNIKPYVLQLENIK